MYKHRYRRALEARPDRLHFAAHSHYPWPDCTREAHLAYWDCAVRGLDDKWDEVFGEVLPEARGHIARLLQLPDANSLAFAPNTHEFVVRLFSCLDLTKNVRVLTTDGEFHSFAREAARMAEFPNVHFERVPVEPFDTFETRFAERAASAQPDLVFLSHVFFNSGFRPELGRILAAIPQNAISVIDGYHAFCALPVDWSEFGKRTFYIAGGYKYAQSGEGACFLHVPPGCQLRPWNTGWWADFAHLENADGKVRYADGGDRFAGSTYDPSGWYRFNAVMRWWKEEGINPSVAQTHAHALAKQFLEGLPPTSLFHKTLLSPQEPERRGSFLAFRLADGEAAADVVQRLRAKNVVIDRRGPIVRFGFGLYQDSADVEALLTHL